MQAQEVFNIAVSGVIKQGKPSRGVGGCFYRHPDDPQIKCAVGHLLNDDEVTEEVAVGELELPERLEPHRDLLKDLQNVHDEAGDHSGEFLQEFIEGCEGIAECHGLDMVEAPRKYSFDVKMFADVTVTAKSEDEARELVRKHFDGGQFEATILEDGRMITASATVDDDELPLKDD